MTDKGSGDAPLLIKALFEWEEHQNSIDRAANLGNTITSPGPYCGADQVKDGDSAKPESAFQGQVEVWGINTQEEIRGVGPKITE
jgi:hypothetical protein